MADKYNNNTKKNSKSNTRPITKKTAGSAMHKSSGKGYDTDFSDAVAMLVAILVSVLLLLSNFNMLGVVGGFLSQIQFGLFGLPAYLFPFLLAGGIFVFALGDEENGMFKKFFAVCIIYVDIEVIFHLFILKKQLDSGMNPYIYSSSLKSGGGVIGGILSALLDKGVGTIGAVIILVLVLLICIIFVMGKSIVHLITTSGNELKRGSRDLNRRAHAAVAEKRKLREERREREKLEREKVWRDNFTSDNNTNIKGVPNPSGMQELNPTPEFGGYESQAEYEYMQRMGNEMYTQEDDNSANYHDNYAAASINNNEFVRNNMETANNSYNTSEINNTNNTSYDNYDAPNHETRNYSTNNYDNSFENVESINGNMPAINSGYAYEGSDNYTNMPSSAATPPRFDISMLSQERFDLDDFNGIEAFHPAEKGSLVTGDPSMQFKKAAPNSFAEIKNNYPHEDSYAGVDEDYSNEDFDNQKNNYQSEDYIRDVENEHLDEAYISENHNDYFEEAPANKNSNDYFEEDSVNKNNNDYFEENSDFEDSNSYAEDRPTEEPSNSLIKTNSSIWESADNTARSSSGAVSFTNNKPKALSQSEAAAKREETEKNKPQKRWIIPDPLKDGLLDIPPKADNDNNDDLEFTKENLKRALEDFGVKVTMGECSRGPAVTRYEIIPERGVKVSKIVSLTDDIKLALAATDVRIEAPIPGKSAVGIEVPNRTKTLVSMFELLNTPAYRNYDVKTGSIAFAVGKGLTGNIEIANIAKMPHVLVAGSTGSGKSVCINTLLMSILFKYSPNEVRLILIDPKVVELSVYNNIPHLLHPVVTDPKQAAAALNWGVTQMDDRYQRFAEAKVRDLKGYNAKLKAIAEETGTEYKPLPQIIIIVDELADLMMTASKEVEASICRLAQLARACGIHLVIATQRPSVDVITGLIKANMPSRIAFAVTSGTDSRTILDANGAEKLLGRGDMLFFPQGIPKPERIQGAYVSDEEVSNVVDFWISQGDGNPYDASIQEHMQNSQISEPSDDLSEQSGTALGNDFDEYLVDSARFLIQKDKASIGMLQRKFKIGFNRAARIMDTLCELGVVSEEEGTKPRRILMSMEQLENAIEEGLL